MDRQLKAKALSLLLCIALLMSVAGCGNNSGKQKNVSADQSLTVKKLSLPGAVGPYERAYYVRKRRRLKFYC